MKCQQCGLVLRSVAHKMSHRRHHFQARPFQCHKDRCLKTFATMVQLQAHRRTHVDRRIYTCRYCHNWFLSRSHRECHRCRFGQPPKHRCPECPAKFYQLLSLSHHIRKSHQAARIKSKSPNQQDLRVENNIGKVLLKISAGKSLTILAEQESSRRAKVKLKRKRKKSFKPKNSGSIILSIKKGMVSIPKELTSSKYEKTKVTTEYDFVPTPIYKVQSQGGELKLKIKTNIPESSVKDSEYANTNNKFSAAHVSGKTDSEDNNESPSKIRNGIIIVKDKKGKLCAEQLALSPYKRKHGENVFDSLKDVGIWKVMPSPRPDGGSEVLKLKLSPQKPIRVIDSSLDEVKYLGISTKTNIEQPSDGGLLDLLPTYSKELDSVSNVNDSGIETEVLSSSSCNRSNGNSVRSVALEENSPTYFNTDGDSLLSPDSPYMDNFNKAEHNICSKCGGIVLETNNNTRSPRKCKCSFSNPNSPFQTPVSPIKVSDMNKMQDITAAPVMLDTQNSSNSLHYELKGHENSGANDDTPTELVDKSVNETNEDYDSDIMVIDIVGKNRSSCSENSLVNSDFKGRLRLKLRSDKRAKGKPNNSVADAETKSNQLLGSGPKSNSTGVEHKNQKSSRRKVELGSQNSPIVVDDVNIDVECKEERTSEIESVCLINKLSRKRPLFKRKSQNVEPEESAVEKREIPVEHIAEVTINDKEVINGDSKGKKPLFKKRQSVENTKEQPINKKPLFKKQLSVDALKEKPTEIMINCVDVVDDSENDKSVNTGYQCHDKPEEHKEQNKLKTFDVEHDDDSLQHWDENIINSICEKELKETKETVQVKDTPKSDVSNKSLNPFQQQFLSFLSSNITEMKKERLSSGSQNNKNNSIEDKQEKCLAVNNDTAITEDFKSKDKIDEEVAEEDKQDRNSKPSTLLKVHDQKETKVEGTPDSFSWLNIFSGSKQDDVACKRNVDEEAHDVMASLSQDLAAINEKMDVSNDEDDNLLDMDDVFKSDKLSTLQPKEFVLEPQVPRKENVSSHLRKRQTAKRTIGKFKAGRRIKKKVELDFTYSASSSDEEMLSEKSDPDFCLHDSENEFETLPPRKKRTLSTRTCSKSKNYDISSGSDNESTGNNQSDNDSISSRNRRTKGNKLSCCSCCKNDCDHRSEHVKNSYKLPRNYRQFIKCTVRLLDVQKKLHRLFLALFPDCAEMISSCKVGTAEFDSLMDEVLGGLDDYEGDPECHRFASESRPKYLQDETCGINNIGMSFTSPNSATRTSEIDYFASDDKLCRTPVSSESSPLYLCSERSYVPYMPAPSSTSLKFENNTLASEDDSVGSPSPRKDSQSCTVSHSCSVTSNSGPVATSQLLLQVASSAGQHLTHEPYNYKDSPSVHLEQMNNFLVTNPDQNTFHQVSDSGAVVAIPFVNPASSGSQVLCEADCEELSSIPIVNITIDLNAAHVALCSNPRHCLQTLHDKIIKLIKVLLPTIGFKSNFFKNLDNLEFLIDLLIDTNQGREVNVEAELKCESLVQSYSPALDGNFEESVLIPADDSVLVIPIVSTDLFKQQIKSQRESLKRDLDVIEEEGKHDENSWKSSEDIWHSFVSLNTLASSSQSPKRRSRDFRLRKRSADEKRTLFVQEKLNNNQNSTFVCHMHDNVNKSVEQTKKNPRAQRGPRNSKERFFSELDLGNPSSSAIPSPVSAVSDEKGSFENSFAAFLNRDNFGCGNIDSRQREELSSKSTVEKNIFELIQSV